MLRWDKYDVAPDRLFFMSSSTVHVPVLLAPVLEGLFPTASEHSAAEPGLAPSEPPTLWVDATLGGGGHALPLAARLRPEDLVIGIDRDPAAIDRFVGLLTARGAVLRETIEVPEAEVPDRRLELAGSCEWLLHQGSYCDLPEILQRHGLKSVSGVLLDLGLSSDQLADTSRGFSFRGTGALDLRFDPSVGISASEWLQRRSEEEIANAIYQYGEERYSRRIARAIVEFRKTQMIATADQLADLVHRAVPGRVHGRIDSATRTFQALRIAVNRELEHVETAMSMLPDCIVLGGHVAIISFHSLEDRIVKHALRNDSRWKVLTKKPIVAEPSEVAANPRSRSAKLRIAQRVEAPPPQPLAPPRW